MLVHILQRIMGACLLTLLSTALGPLSPEQQVRPPADALPLATLGDAATLRAAYLRWKVAADRQGLDRMLVLPLRVRPGRAAAHSHTRGSMQLDLVTGVARVEVQGLDPETAFDVWLLSRAADAEPGSPRPPPGAQVHLGRLQPSGPTAMLQTALDLQSAQPFQLDHVVVVRQGEAPLTAGHLFGSPSLFQRLYYREVQTQTEPLPSRRGVPSVATDTPRRRTVEAPFLALIPPPAYAHAVLPVQDSPTDLEHLIAQGQAVFMHETFQGNGRTCATCHPAVNNFTIDPQFIAGLDCQDALFVAEHAARSDTCPAAAGQDPSLATLERPTLMRQFGLILVNADGHEDLEHNFTMRGVPHLLALGTSVAGGAFGNPAPAALTGWSGDGAPVDATRPDADGSLRAFMIGAIMQHYPKTLQRRAGQDFRLPTPVELDAVEAFLLSLGRQADPDLSQIQLMGVVPRRGLELFRTDGKCVSCHFNAGATPLPNNSRFHPEIGGLQNTGIEFLQDVQVRLPGVLPFPCDGGFGTDPQPAQFRRLCHPSSAPADQMFSSPQFLGAFNTPGLVEAADTAPFFHNNSLNTLEGAVAFYNSEEFNALVAPAQQITLGPAQVEAIAAFLRVLNALENIRNALALTQRTLQNLDRAPRANLKLLLQVAQADTQDAIKVLSTVHLHPEAVERLRAAQALLSEALHTLPLGRRGTSQVRQVIKGAVQAYTRARTHLCVPGSELAAGLCPGRLSI